MISWMQKHNKYLVVTIWIATIAFIGAGFVGWGSYQFGSKASSIAKVGDIEITHEKFDMAYRNTYQQYNQMMEGQLDEKKAQELGITEKAFSNLASQTLLLNQANEFGIIVTDEEILQELHAIAAFQTNNQFDEKVYKSYLTNQRMKAKTFEALLKDDLTIKKLMDLLNSKAYPFEKEIISSALSVADKIAYKVLTQQDVNSSIDEGELKKFWEAHKGNYMTPKKFELDVLWTSSHDVNYTDAEIAQMYNQNGFNYIDSEGKQLSISDAKEQIIRDIKLQKTKKIAQKEYIEFKKGNKNKSETLIMALNDTKLPPDVWEELISKDINTFLKPKAVGDRYATIKIVKIIEPTQMNFEEAKDIATSEYENMVIPERLQKKAALVLANFSESNATVSDFLFVNSKNTLTPLNIQNTQDFLQKLFTSQKEKGIISINKKIIVYEILEQKLQNDENEEKKMFVDKSVNQMKNQDFQSNLIKNLNKKYNTEKFVKGI